MHPERRLAAYIDGFNLYYALRDARLHKHKWLDLCDMCLSLLKPGQTLEFIRYFTSRIRGNPAATARQARYLDALTVKDNITIDYDNFLTKEVRCRKCKNTWTKHEEKKTDVNISIRLLEDAYAGNFDIALWISSDSDLVPPVKYIHTHFPDKEGVMTSPPKRKSKQLNAAASKTFPISKATIRSNRLPNPVIVHNGLELYASDEWDVAT